MEARRICPHVHCRDEHWSHKSTIAETLKIAESQGICAIFDMPNNMPLTLNADDVRRRLALVPEDSQVEYYTYVGLTKDVDQIVCAVNCWRMFPQVVGLKMFAGRSVGSMSVTEEADQLTVYHALAGLGYEGVVAIHCEKESFLKPELWDPKVPVSHSLARPKEAEIESIKDQIKFAKESGFRGILHICHVSCPESVELVTRARGSIRITCGVTPHHLLLSVSAQEAMLSLGNLYKVNPPLRLEYNRVALMDCLTQGDIDWIETDQAMHTLSEKISGPFMSGIPSLLLYNDLLERIRAEIPANQLDRLTFGNIIKAFAPKLNHLLIS
jgi:dihydroorotase